MTRYLNLSFILALFISCLCLSPHSYSQKEFYPGKTSPPDDIGDTIDAVQYNIHILNINFLASSIEGFTEIVLTPLANDVASIPLQLINLSVDSVFFEENEVINFAQDDSLIRIPVASPINPGDTVKVTVYYHGVPFHEDWGGFHFSGNYAFNLGVGLNVTPHNLGKSWFPCIDNFTDRATYDVFCILPDNMTATAGGLLVDHIPHGNGTSTWHWHCDYEMPTYLASLAAGDYSVVKDTFEGIAADIPIEIYTRPQDSSKVAGTFVNLKQVLQIFEDCMGPYPWEKVGYTATNLGAMEHATNIFINHFLISGNTSYEETIIHELSHMWMGDKVTCFSAEEMWLNEGWATFFGLYYAKVLHNDENGFKTGLRDKHAQVLQYCHTPGGDGSYFPMNNIPQTKTYGMAAYDKGATVAQALRFYLGDSLFFLGLKGYLTAYAYNSVDSWAFRDVLTSITGVDMTGFFDNWIFNAGTPGYSIDSFQVTPDGNQFDVTVCARQKRKGPAFTGNDNIMEVMFIDQNWNRITDTLHFSGPAGNAVRTLPFAPSAVLVDPEEKMCDATTDLCKIIHATGVYSFEKTYFTIDIDEMNDSALIQATHYWVPPDTLRIPVSGLRLSDYRYWHIDGIVPAGFLATGKFFYGTNGYLDNTLITSAQDSVVILYRKNASEEWQTVEFEKVGIWNIGNLYVSDLKFGDYTLAVWDTQVGAAENDLQEKEFLDIYPNPSRDVFMIKFDPDTRGEIRIFDTTGIMVRLFRLTPGQNMVTWDPSDLPAGNYYIALFSSDNKQLGRRTIIYMR